MNEEQWDERPGGGLGGPDSRDALRGKRRMEEVMATPIQNEAQAGPPVNVLHDQNIPNTLGGVRPPTKAVRLRLPAAAFVAAVVVIALVLVILVARLG
jgi:hypothetical protein